MQNYLTWSYSKVNQWPHQVPVFERWLLTAFLILMLSSCQNEGQTHIGCQGNTLAEKQVFADFITQYLQAEKDEKQTFAKSTAIIRLPLKTSQKSTIDTLTTNSELMLWGDIVNKNLVATFNQTPYKGFQCIVYLPEISLMNQTSHLPLVEDSINHLVYYLTEYRITLGMRYDADFFQYQLTQSTGQVMKLSENIKNVAMVGFFHTDTLQTTNMLQQIDTLIVDGN